MNQISEKINIIAGEYEELPKSNITLYMDVECSQHDTSFNFPTVKFSFIPKVGSMRNEIILPHGNAEELRLIATLVNKIADQIENVQKGIIIWEK